MRNAVHHDRREFPSARTSSPSVFVSNLFLTHLTSPLHLFYRSSLRWSSFSGIKSIRFLELNLQLHLPSVRRVFSVPFLPSPNSCSLASLSSFIYRFISSLSSLPSPHGQSRTRGSSLSSSTSRPRLGSIRHSLRRRLRGGGVPEASPGDFAQPSGGKSVR